MARVNVSGDSIFREELASQGFIGSFEYKEGSVHEAAILKVATAGDNEFHVGKLPSWVLFEEIVGEEIAVNEVNKLGNYNYNAKLTIEDNLALYILGKTVADLANTPPNTEYVGQDLSNMLSTTSLLDYGGELSGVIHSLREKPEVTSEDRVNLYNKVVEIFPTVKDDFIKNRTQLLIPSGITVSTKINDQFRNGTISRDKEDTRTVNRYWSLTNAIMKKKFEEQSNLSFSDPSISKKEINKKYRDFLFIQGEPLTRPTIRGILFIATREVFKFNNMWQPKADEDQNEDYKLKFYRLSNSKYSKINIRRTSPGVDTELDYVMVRLEFNNGKTKSEAGRNMVVAEHGVRLDPDKILSYFMAALPELSYKKCYDLQDYPLKDVVGQAILYITENKKYLDRLTGEEKEKLGDSLELVDGLVDKESIDDIIGQVNSEIDFTRVMSTADQKAAQLSQQQAPPVQQVQQQQAQQPVQQAYTAQQPVQQPAQQVQQQAPVGQQGQNPQQWTPQQPQQPVQQVQSQPQQPVQQSQQPVQQPQQQQAQNSFQPINEELVDFGSLEEDSVSFGLVDF